MRRPDFDPNSPYLGQTLRYPIGSLRHLLSLPIDEQLEFFGPLLFGGIPGAVACYLISRVYEFQLVFIEFAVGFVVTLGPLLLVCAVVVTSTMSLKTYARYGVQWTVASTGWMAGWAVAYQVITWPMPGY